MGNKLSIVKRYSLSDSQKKSKITQSMSMERELKAEPGMFTVCSVEYLVDTDPMILNGSCFINLQPQNITLEFKMTLSGDDVCFVLDNVLHRDRYANIVEIMSEQILIPLAISQNITQENAIISFFRKDEMHLRILNRQIGKIWFLEDNIIQPFSFNSCDDIWRFMITDQNNWSTGHV